MKKLILVLCLFVASTQFADAQIHFGIKGGINYNSDSFIDSADDIINGNAEGRTGYHAGLWLRFKLPMVGWYIRPELVYTSLKSEVELRTAATTAGYNFQKIDIPVLIGKKFLKVAYVHIGPSFQYLLDGDLDFDAVSNLKADGFTVGMNIGAGIELGKFGIEARWERAFSDVESEVVGLTGVNTSNFDTRVNQVIFGLSYRF
ncbi:porin family protein [Tenacibaculum sp. 190524A05c]|uniref:porin family protein n=1 Tax=Tenacibaculum platacis TaxID=3137852 RepID=UPI0031FB8510